MAGTFFFSHLLWPWRRLLPGAVLCFSVLAAILTIEPVRAALFPDFSATPSISIIQFLLFSFTGAQIVLLAALDIWEHKTPESLLLVLLVCGTLLFTCYINWTISARNILPLIPAVGILIARRLAKKFDPLKPRMVVAYCWPLLPAAALALTAAWADVSLANCQRKAAELIHHEFRGYPYKIWFEGHWGFQYYMESFGAKAIDYGKVTIGTGDIVVIPKHNTNLVALSPRQFHLAGMRQLAPYPWMATMSKKYASGFYWNIYGPLPFSAGNIEPEEYLIFLAGDFENPEEAIKNFGKQLKAGRF